MKKILSGALALTLALALLTGCSVPGTGGDATPPALPTPTPTPTPGIETIKTVGDALALNSAETQSAAYETAFVYVFLLDGAYYRAIAPMTEETAAAIWALSYDENYEANWSALVSPLRIEKVENLSALIPTQEELNTLVGKTGAELLEEGWQSFGYNLDTMEFFLANDPFKYKVTFDGEIEVGEDFDELDAISSLTVKSVAFDGLGDAANIDGEVG